MTSKVKRELTYLIPFTQPLAGQSQKVVSMLSNNPQYWLQGSIETLSKKMGKEIVLNKGEYTDKELNAIIGPKMKSQMNDRDDILRTSRL